MIRITGYGVIAEKPRVGKLGPIFPCTLLEKLCVGSKNEWLFFDGHDELYHHAKFGEDRTMRAGCRCENVFCFLFVCWSRSDSGAPCVRGLHSSSKHCIAVYCPISTRFSAFFSEVIALLGALHSSHFRSQVAPQFSRNCGQKLRKSKKSAEKFVRTTSYRQLTVLKKNLLQ